MTLAARPSTDAGHRFRDVRARTDVLAALPSAEDQMTQSMPDASPTKWHRAHTSWFFEEFLLEPAGSDDIHDATFRYLFNSYDEAVGPRHPRPQRGSVTRPSAAEVGRYRVHVDAAVERLLEAGRVDEDVLVLGLDHEQQHQELLVIDVKHLLSCHPFGPGLVDRPGEDDPDPVPLTWREVPAGLFEVGHDVDDPGFAYDNEGPRHLVWLEPFAIAERVVTDKDWLAFLADGGCAWPELWLSDGWHAVQDHGWVAPGYWSQVDGRWQVFTSAGVRPVRRAEPVCHVSSYEADAYARWAGARLPAEHEWEVAAGPVAHLRGQLLDPGRLHPGVAGSHMLGDVWEWTASAYLPYPEFVPVDGAIGECNGKFMCDQHVLRGACCATPAGHERPTYRNVFPAGARWAFSGLRLARS